MESGAALHPSRNKKQENRELVGLQKWLDTPLDVVNTENEISGGRNVKL